MIGATTSYTVVSLQFLVNTVMKTVKDGQKQVLINIMRIYVTQKLKIALNSFIVKNIVIKVIIS